MSYFPRNATIYRQAFTLSDLSNGSLVVNHGLAEDYPAVQVWSNTRDLLIPDNVKSIDPNNIRFSVESFGNIVGNWIVVVLK